MFGSRITIETIGETSLERVHFVPMNICFFNWREYAIGQPTPGGIERVSALLAKELRRRGHCVEFYYSPKPKLSIVSRFLPSSRYSESKRFCDFLKEHKIDIAVRHGMLCDSHLLLKKLPCKLIMVLHSRPRNAPSAESYADHFIEKRKIRSHVGQLIIRSKLFSFLGWKYHEFRRNRSFSRDVCRSDKFVLLSERFLPEFAPSKKFPHKVCAIPNIASAKEQSVSLDEKKKELLWLGRMDFAQKRPDFMLQIWQRLQDRFTDWSLHFVGDGPYLPELKTLATSLGAKNVSFEGFQDPAPYYRSASILCMTSTGEGFPTVLTEAQSFGCVPVAFDSFSSVHDIIEDGVSGVVVPAFDLDKYAEKLSGLMSDSGLRKNLALNAQKSVSRFSPEKIGDKWEKVFQSII